MSDLTLRDIPQDTLDVIRARAERRGQSIEASVMELIHSAASEERLRQDLERGMRAMESASRRSPSAEARASRSSRRYRRAESAAP
jgi:plasmid stability protein